MKKYTLLLASFTLFGLVSSVTAMDYEPGILFNNIEYGYDDFGQLNASGNCAFQFASFDGSVNCISGMPSGWNRPKSDYWHHEASYLVDTSKG